MAYFRILKYLIVLIFIIISTCLKAQDTIIKVKIYNFNGISVKSGIDMILTQANEEKIEIKGLKTFAEDVVITKTDSGLLKFEMNKFTLKNWKWGKNESLKIYISVKNIKNIHVSECATVLANSIISINTLNVNVDDGSDLKLNLNTNNLNVTIKNGSNFYLIGKTNTFNLIGKNAITIKAFNLISNTVNANLTDGSDAELFATENIFVNAKNGCDILYTGAATKKKFKKAVFCTIKKIN